MMVCLQLQVYMVTRVLLCHYPPYRPEAVPEGQSNVRKLAFMRGVGMYMPPLWHGFVPVVQCSTDGGKERTAGHRY